MYEIHITVKAKDIDKFKEDCKDIGVKPIVLDLQVSEDVMTSSTCEDNVMIVASNIVHALKDRGYPIIRIKIETSPDHPDVPTKENRKEIGVARYFETHIEVEKTDKNAEIAKKHGAHISKNIFKDGKVMVTLRKYKGNLEEFDYAADNLMKELGVDKRITEFALWDTKPRHDDLWFGL